MGSQLNSANDDLVLNATGGSDLVFQQDGVEKGRVGAGGFGKVLQVVSTTFLDPLIVNSNTYVNVPELALSITPSSATSKILITLDAALGGDGEVGGGARLLRDGLQIATPQSASLRPKHFVTRGYDPSYGTYDIEESSKSFLDSPSTTSQVDYTIEIKADHGTYICLNRTGSDRDAATYEPRSVSTITLMEIGV